MLKQISFSTDLPLKHLKRPIQAASLVEDRHGKCKSLTLWFADGDRVRIHSEMHDLEPKLEVGVLTFTDDSSINKNPKLVRFAQPMKPIRLEKLLVEESGNKVESGIRLTFESEQFLTIVPADFPCFLAVIGTVIQSALQRTEYPVEHYQAVDVLEEVVI